MLGKPLVSIMTLLALTSTVGCAQYRNSRGVDVTWTDAATAGFERGSTTRTEVLRQLGPPSQVIALDDGSALYYLRERGDGEGLVLLVYSRFRLDTRYDRAVFFFDDDGVLTDFSTYIEPLES